jgi:hypothetical protein
MKKFLSDVLIECGLQVSGTTALGTATATTVATSDNSTNIATTAWVKSLGYSTTDSYVSGVSLNGNLLSFTGVNSAFTGSIDLSSITSSFNPSDVTTVYERVKNASGGIIYKGTPLAVVPGQTSGNISDVVPADASDPAFMPAIFIANVDMADEAEGEAVLFGNLTGVNTELYESGTTVYVAPGGGWTADKPIWPNLIQNLGVITKQHHSNGAGIVTGVGRANSLPNLTAGKIWVGSAAHPIESTTVHVDEANGRVGIGTTSPAFPLTVYHATNSAATFQTSGTGTGAGNGFYVGHASNISYVWNYNNFPLVLATNNIERVRVTGGGNVGIGTTSPAAKLHLSGSGVTELRITSTTGNTNSLLSFYESALASWGIDAGQANGSFFIKDLYNSATRLTISYTGNVGIGTTSPAYKLDISGQIRVDNGVGNGSGQALIVGGSGDVTLTSGGSLFFGAYDYGNSTYIRGYDNSAGLYFYADGTLTMNVAGNGNVGIGTTSPDRGLTISRSNQYASLNIYKANTTNQIVYLGTGSSGADDDAILQLFDEATEKVRIFTAGNSWFNGGNVGIGTTNPEARLHVAGGHLLLNNGIELRSKDTGGSVRTIARVNGSTNDLEYGWSGAGAVKFMGGGAYTERMRIHTDGNVGISTTSPEEKLHVAGNVRIDGGSTAAILETNDATAAEAGTTYKTFTTADNYAVFVDYVVYDAGRDNMRTGTFRAVWSTGDVVYTDVSTVDLGATDSVTLTAAISGANVNLIVMGPADYTLKYNLKVIK